MLLAVIPRAIAIGVQEPGASPEYAHRSAARAAGGAEEPTSTCRATINRAAYDARVARAALVGGDIWGHRIRALSPWSTRQAAVHGEDGSGSCCCRPGQSRC